MLLEHGAAVLALALRLQVAVERADDRFEFRVFPHERFKRRKVLRRFRLCQRFGQDLIPFLQFFQLFNHVPLPRSRAVFRRNP